MERVEEFEQQGKSFMYIDLSNLMTNNDFLSLTQKIEPMIAKYPEHSLYTITNIENVRFDSKSRDLVTGYMRNNKPYVKYGAVIGLDGIKKIMVSTIVKLSGRNNMHFAFTKEQAIEWLLQQG